MGEHLWFCDLVIEGEKIVHIPDITYEPYPSSHIQRKRFSSMDWSKCNLGYPIQSTKQMKKFFCLCPPSYYGDHCQYQSEHLIIQIQIDIAYPMDVTTVFRLIVYLFNEDNLIESYEETVYDLRKINLGEIVNE